MGKGGKGERGAGEVGRGLGNAGGVVRKKGKKMFVSRVWRRAKEVLCFE